MTDHQSDPASSPPILKGKWRVLSASFNDDGTASMIIEKERPETQHCVSDEELEDIADSTPWEGSPRLFGRKVARQAIALALSRHSETPRPAERFDIKRNINLLRIKAKFNEKGRRIFGEYCGKYACTSDSEGYTVLSLWEFMAVFGPHVYIGKDLPFDPNLQLIIFP
jgi:hypothetical protein